MSYLKGHCILCSFLYRNLHLVSGKTCSALCLWLEAWQISSALSHHIHNTKCLQIWFEIFSTNLLVFVMKVRTFNLIFLMTDNYVPAWREPCAKTYEWVWCGWLWVRNCPQMRNNANHTLNWNKSVQIACAKDYKQMVIYSTGVFLKSAVHYRHS